MTTANPFIYQDGDQQLIGEIYRPRGAGNGRAVLVVHEADGIGGNVRRHCALLAEQGYVAAAADMHGDGRVLQGEEIMPAMNVFLTNRELMRRRVRVAYEAMLWQVGVSGGQAAAIGYCFGGATVLELARSGADLAAVGSFHGLLTTSTPARNGDIKARVLVCTGHRDPLVPWDDVTAFQAEMAAAGADWQLAIYGRALHSFTNEAVDGLNDPRMAYDRHADEASWAALVLFLQQSFALRE